ncbi:MAG: indolepyruvate ferredoxin oxidoreductase subunit alpha [Ectothiorhodospiraceae bacterium]|nr:indolepyruvate ferredoxin oxidoreductase subunit alpha [Ectothiorhodospiraceae bacterium]
MSFEMSATMNTTAFLSGSEAISRGAYEAGVKFGCGFYGTPVTDILTHFQKEYERNVQWTPNEKVAVEVAYGTITGGVRSMVVLKNSGINNASEPLVSAAYHGVNAGLVIVAIDDPGMLTSSNEQDTRHFARSAKLPLLAPSDPQEALDFVKLAFKMSEQYNLPVVVRLTSRLCFTRSVCRLDEPLTNGIKSPLDEIPRLSDRSKRHGEIEKQLAAIGSFGNKAFDINTIDVGSPDVGIITSGISYAYAKEVLPEASYLKIGIIHPLPQQLITYFAGLVQRLYVIEELDPFIEEQIRAMGIKVIGKEVFPHTGELNPDIVAKGLEAEGVKSEELQRDIIELPVKQDASCAGCQHQGLMNVFTKLGLHVVGDIGCYAAGETPPNPDHEMGCFCIGASMSIAYGISLAQNSHADNKTVALLSGSTFLHSGLQSLSNIVSNKGTATVCILAHEGSESDNGTKKIDFEQICRGLGIESLHKVDSTDEAAIERALGEELPKPGVSVIIASAHSAD